jgi:hypothetical protein
MNTAGNTVSEIDPVIAHFSVFSRADTVFRTRGRAVDDA